MEVHRRVELVTADSVRTGLDPVHRRVTIVCIENEEKRRALLFALERHGMDLVAGSQWQSLRG